MQLAGKHRGERHEAHSSLGTGHEPRRRRAASLGLPTSLPAFPPGFWASGSQKYLQFGVGRVDQPVAEDGVPVLNVRAAARASTVSAPAPQRPAPRCPMGVPAAPRHPPVAHWKAKVLP